MSEFDGAQLFWAENDGTGYFTRRVLAALATPVAGVSYHGVWFADVADPRMYDDAGCVPWIDIVLFAAPTSKRHGPPR